MPMVVYEEKKRQMDDLMELMTKQTKFYNDILKQPVPVPLRLLYLTQIEYLNSREFILDCLKKETPAKYEYDDDADDEEDDNDDCVYCYYICKHCYAFHKDELDCKKCGKTSCVLTYQEKNSSLALKTAKAM
tara:strand:+ start:59 stop:454 length:396 start_codon:yes stop_codon:yes gene_type:complete